MIQLINGGGARRLTRAGETRRADAEKQRADRAELDLALRTRELAQAKQDRDELQKRHDALQEMFTAVAADFRELTSGLTATRAAQAKATTQHAPAPVDMQDGDGWDPEASVTTAFLRLRAATYGPGTVGPAVIPVLPQGSQQ